jgi:hypothetical protein
MTLTLSFPAFNDNLDVSLDIAFLSFEMRINYWFTAEVRGQFNPSQVQGKLLKRV